VAGKAAARAAPAAAPAMATTNGCSRTDVIVWDIETVPDIKGFAVANGHAGKSDEEVRGLMGDKFPKHIYHAIICIGALVTWTTMNATTRYMKNPKRRSIPTILSNEER
jgi:hypothetical protein